jgi:hypothetical protein
VQIQHSTFLHGRIHCPILFGDSSSLVCSLFIGIWHCMRILTLFVRWKIHCKHVFENEVSSLLAFCHMWRDEVCMQLLAKGFLLIKDVNQLEPHACLNFINALVALRKRIKVQLYIPFHLLLC